MRNNISTEITFEIFGQEIGLDITFDYYPGCPATHIDPPESPECDITAIKIVTYEQKPAVNNPLKKFWVKKDEHDCPDWLFQIVAASDEVQDQLNNAANEDDRGI
jgi:hypothetical protein